MRNQTKQTQLRHVGDVLDVLGGRWRGAVLASLCGADKRFNELRRDLPPITSRTLSRELSYLQECKLVRVTRTSAEATYSLTPHGRSLEPLIGQIVAWGQRHRRVVLAAD